MTPDASCSLSGGKLVAAKAKIAAFHAHGCVRCHRRYMDACKNLHADELCFPCRTGKPPSVYDASRLPLPCCATESRLITDPAELARYALAGAHPWWRCRRCSRTQPFDPALEPA